MTSVNLTGLSPNIPPQYPTLTLPWPEQIRWLHWLAIGSACSGTFLSYKPWDGTTGSQKDKTLLCSSPSVPVSRSQHEVVLCQETPTSAPVLFVVIEAYRDHVGWGLRSGLSAPFDLPWKRKFPWISLFIGDRTGTAWWPKTMGCPEEDSLQWSSGTQHNEMGAPAFPGQHGGLAAWPVSLLSSYLPVEMRSSALVLEHFKYMWRGSDLSSG